MRKLVYSNSFYVINCVKTTFFQRDFERDKKNTLARQAQCFKLRAQTATKSDKKPLNSRCFMQRARFDRRLLGEDCAETSTRKQLPLRVNKSLEFVSLSAY